MLLQQLFIGCSAVIPAYRAESKVKAAVSPIN